MRNALTRAVFFNRLGEIRDSSFEQQRYRAMEYGLPGAGHRCVAGSWPGRGHLAIAIAAALGLGQPHGRLRLA